jgi:GNAT superfamily N-acetyltransferase
LNGKLPNASICYGVYDDKKIVAFMGVLHQPHGINKKIKRVCRLVVLPDYQGVGIGTRFLKTIAEHYTKMKFDFSIVTSAKNLIYALNNSNDWLLQRYSANKCSSNKNVIDYKRSSMRTKCKTASFFYKRIK